MAPRSKNNETRFGFLTAIEVEDQGWLGGLLVTTLTGRPLEFQCTTPVKANRTQEILYGPTLTSFLLGELLGKTLYDRAEVKPLLMLTDRPEMLDLRTHIEVPVLYLFDDQSESISTGTAFRFDGRKYAHHVDFVEDQQMGEKQLEPLPEKADLGEPLYRVGLALQETLRSSSAA